MDYETVALRIRALFRELHPEGGSTSAKAEGWIRPLPADSLPLDPVEKELERLREEVTKLRKERDRLAALQEEIVELLSCKSPDMIIHDLRNLLNDVMLLKIMLERSDERSEP